MRYGETVNDVLEPAGRHRPLFFWRDLYAEVLLQRFVTATV
jgi:hypothetical protein